MVERVLTGFTELDDMELDKQSNNAVTSLTGNANFTWTGTALIDFTKASQIYHNAMGELNTGGSQAVVDKNNARVVLLPLFSSAAIIVNQQAVGNLTMLLTSGIKLAAHKEHHEQPLPINMQVANGVNGDMDISVKHSPVGDHGTVFAYTPVANTGTDPNTWVLKTVNGHKATISGLAPGSQFLFTAAYKGLDSEKLVWAAPVSKFVGN